MPTELLLIGAGGHAKVVIETIQKMGRNCKIHLVDEDLAKVGEKLLGNHTINNLKDWEKLPVHYHVAIGNNAIRQKLSNQAQKQNKEPYSLLHPDASISPSATIEGACFVASNAVIAAESNICEGCIINHGSIVDHDCKIGAFSHIAPNATLGGNVEIGRECFIGAGATILPNIRIGHQVAVGAGAVIVNDVPDNQTVRGIPGRCI